MPIHSKKYYSFHCIIFLFFYSFPLAVQSQKYAFVKYDVENGLIQSQVNAFCQDTDRNIWVATNGGLSKFDGIKFTDYTQEDGLIDNYTTTLLADKKNNIWVGTQSGLSCFDGRTFKNYFFKNNGIMFTAEDKQGNIWVISGGNLYRISGRKTDSIYVVNNSEEQYTCLNVDSNGNPWVAVYKRGVYCLEGNTWIKKFNPGQQNASKLFTALFFKNGNPDSAFLLYKKGLLFISGNKIISEINNSASMQGDFINAKEDTYSNLWIVTSKGLYKYDKNNIVSFSASNGFTDNKVNNIFSDYENNLWFATEGAGIFRYSFSNYEFFDQSTGLTNTMISGITQDLKKRLLFSTLGGGLYLYDDKKFINIKLPSPDPNAQKVSCLFNDGINGLLVGTENGGLWNYTKNKFTRIDNIPGQSPWGCNSIMKDSRGIIWLSTPVGLYTLVPGKAILKFKPFTSCSVEIGKDSIVAGSIDGLYLIRENISAKILTAPVMFKNVICLLKFNNFLFIGTENKGLVVWDLQKNKFTAITLKEGLTTNFIYSLLESNGAIWAGTAKGINKILFHSTDNYTIENFAEPGTMTAGEFDQNAAFKDEAGNLWFGSVKGLVKFNPAMPVPKQLPVHVVLQFVQLFSKNFKNGEFADSLPATYHNQSTLRLPFNKNHLTFEFRAISFREAASTQYQYKLEGLDNEFSDLTTKPFVVYPDLSPGNYTFTARAFTPGAGFSENTIKFPFEIIAPFYKTMVFKLSVILLFLALIFFIQEYRSRLKTRRILELSLIKTREEYKIRQRTAEDFHDELGNKLTRISVLTDILQTKINSKDSSGIILQIKENVSALYKGTRDILWSLNPESDKLPEIIKHLRNCGNELFAETNIFFEFEQLNEINENIRVPDNYGRNITMIFKEAMSNSLKHAACSKVKFSVSCNGDNRAFFSLEDNGKGFNINATTKGYGINNIRMRAGRINALLDIESLDAGGTLISLFVKIPR